MANIDKIEDYILKQDNSNKDKIRDNIFDFIINKQFYCAVAYAKACKYREDEYNKEFEKEIKELEQKSEEVETTEDLDAICEQIDKIEAKKFYYFNNLYTALAYAFDDRWYDNEKVYERFNFKDKTIEDKDFSSFFTSSDDKNFIYLLFLSIAIRALYCKKSVYWNSLEKQLPKDNGCYNTKIRNIIEELLKDVINDIESFKKATGTVLSICADKKQNFKDKKEINNIDEDIKKIEDLRNTFLECDNSLEKDIRKDILGDNVDNIVYTFYKDAIKKQNTREILSDVVYQVEILDDNNKIAFDKSVDIIERAYKKIIKNNKYSNNSEEYDYDKIVDDLNIFLNEILNFLYKCDNLSNTSEDNVGNKYIREWKCYFEHLEEAIEKLEEKERNKEKADDGYIAGICVLEYILRYIQDLISMDTEEDDYKYEYSKYFYVPFLLSNHVMLNDDFCPDFPILYNDKLKKQTNGNFFVKSIQPEYRIIKQAKEFQNFDYIVSDFKRELRLRQNKEENNRYNYSSKGLVSIYDSFFPNDISKIEKAKKNASSKLFDFIGELELALWYRQLEEKLQLKKDELDEEYEDKAYKVYLNFRNNIGEWYYLLCEEKSNYYFFEQLVIEYRHCIEDNVYKLKEDCLKEFKKINDDKVFSYEKVFFEKFYDIVKYKVEIKDDNVTFNDILENFSEELEESEDYELKDCEKIRKFFEEFYNIVFKHRNFSMFSKYLYNFDKGELSKLSSSEKLDNYLSDFMDSAVFNDSKRYVDNIDDERPLKIRVVLGKDCKDIISAQTLAEAWDKIFLLDKKKIDEKIDDIFKDFLKYLGFDVENISKGKGSPLVCNDNFIVKLSPKKFNHPIAAFGSDAVDNGFRVVCIDRDEIGYDNNVDFLINFIKKLGTDCNTMILLDHVLTLQDRRTLAKRIKIEIKKFNDFNDSKNKNSLFLVVDRVAISFFMKHYNKKEINKMFLSVLSPFGFYQPYISSDGIGVTEAKSLNEMFIGRNEELGKIKNINIPINIVYGGRQLGKSSLLTKATKDINDKKDGGKAVYISLEEVNAPTLDIDVEKIDKNVLEIIVEKMQQKAKIFKDNLEIVDTWEDFKKGIKKIIDSDEISYLVLLIDEVDNFFKACENNEKNPMKIFSEIVRYAEEQQKKFKVVFAGLNMIKDYKFLTGGNGLLGQIDDDQTEDGTYYVPILPFNDEYARQLIEKPLRYLGLYFSKDSESLDSESLIYLILDQTNYYPCLIQFYCERLLEVMCKENYARYSENKAPVYYVTEGHIKDILSHKGFRDTVKHKFDITLDLSPTDSKADHTYRDLANILAYLRYNRCEEYSYKIKDFVEVAEENNMKHICDLDKQDKLQLYMNHLVELSVFRCEEVKEKGIKVKKYGFRRLPLLELMGSKDKIDKKIKSFSSDK